MSFPFKTLFVIVLLGVLLIPIQGLPEEPAPNGQAIESKQEAPVEAPDLADIVPMAAQLNSRIADLRKQLEEGIDIAAVEKQYEEFGTRLQQLSGRLDKLRETEEYKYRKLVELRGQIRQTNELYEIKGTLIKDAIRQLEIRRKAWLDEQKQWTELQGSLDKEEEFHTLRPTFEKANDTIENALNMIGSRLEAVLVLQGKAGVNEEKITGLDRELGALIEDERRITLLEESPPIFSTQFVSQVTSSNVWSAAFKGMKEISWPDRHFLLTQGWIVLLQVFISLATIIAVYRHQQKLNQSERWRFIGVRPFSTGLFVGYMSTVLIYEYVGGTPGSWIMLLTIIGATSFARLMGIWVGIAWKKHFINGLMIFLIVTYLMDVLSFPIPLLRVYTVLAALIALLFCLGLARESIQKKDQIPYPWLLRSVALFFAVIIIAELWGKRALAAHLFIAFIDSLATILVFVLFLFIIRGGLEWLFRHSPLLRTSEIASEDTEIIIARLGRFIDIAIVALILLPALLMIWGAYDNLLEATKGLLSLEFSLGSLRISLGLLLVSVSLVYGSFLVSWFVKKMLVDEEHFKYRLERGARISIAHLLHYAIIVTGFLVALSTLGFEISKITIMLSALGVGIGFGLQGIVNNFVSGLVLLFERPVRVGDVIQLGGEWAEINKIGIRATTVQTFDRADRIIPNSDLIANQVTNWTLSNRQIRLIIPVGVAYGSDVDKVTETLLACAQTNPQVARRPAPNVLFLSFGESTLDFELRVFVTEFNHRIEVQSALHRQIERRFRTENIEIAFPQRDLHLRSMDDSAKLPPSLPVNNDLDESRQSARPATT